MKISVTVPREWEKRNRKLLNGHRVSNSHKKAVDIGYTFNLHILKMVNFKVYFISIKNKIKFQRYIQLQCYLMELL